MSSEPTTPGHRRVLITGSRTWTDTATIRDVLAQQWGDGTAVLITGACPRGADALAEQCWTAWGGQVERHPADWNRHGRSAGYRRNADMVAATADVCLAFLHGPSRGTRHTAELATSACIPTRYVHHPASDSESTAMPGTDHHDEGTHGPAAGEPSIAEIAALTSRLRHLRSPDATDAERAAFIAEKNALLARIPDQTQPTDRTTQIDGEQVRAAVLPVEMVDGIERRRSEATQRDDPAELQTRLDDLRARVAAAHAATEHDDTDQARTEQLGLWHTDDQAETGDHSAQDDAGWSR